MTHSTDTELVLSLQHINELFNAPDRDPFSEREIDVLGESGFDIVWKRMVQRWPQRSDLQRVIVQLPPDQLTPILTETTRAAWQHYCAAKIEDNRLRRRVNTGKALRQWGYAGILLGLTLGLIILLFTGPLQILPEWLRALLSILAVYGFALANWDALDSLLFDWAPFVRDNATYTSISALDIRFEAWPR
ncbi:MAG TPA: hypothetical protein VMP08_21970 [Anaerolineae bacterium]|nr:hypothetical protein [Anaerolineae bacterium]